MNKWINDTRRRYLLMFHRMKAGTRSRFSQNQNVQKPSWSRGYTSCIQLPMICTCTTQNYITAVIVVWYVYTQTATSDNSQRCCLSCPCRACTDMAWPHALYMPSTVGGVKSGVRCVIGARCCRLFYYVLLGVPQNANFTCFGRES